MFFCRLTTEKLLCAEHTTPVESVAASWCPLWKHALIAGKGCKE